jgi:tagatose 6-phosphate kinase
MRESSAVVLSGSLARGLPPDAYLELVRRARARNRPVILDAGGAPFAAALAAGPSVVKPNRDELMEATSGPTLGARGRLTIAEVTRRAEELRARGAESVVVSLGRDGMVAATPDGIWHAHLPDHTTISGNPTGAGDAGVAALARGVVEGTEWPDRVGDAVALSAAAVLHPVAGGFDPAAYISFRDRVQVREIVAPRGA